MIRHPASVLHQLARPARSVRLVLLGKNPFVRSIFLDILSAHSTSLEQVEIMPTDVRQQALLLRDQLLTVPLPWDNPLIWVAKADHLLSAMSFPEDLPHSPRSLVLESEPDSVYVPVSFTPVQIEFKAAANLQEFVRWLMDRKGLNGELDAVRFLAAEYKENLPALDKMLDQLVLELYPRTVVSLKDLETVDEGWDATTLLHSIVKNEEHKVLSELMKALETFHPKGILTVLSRRVILLIQVAHANLKFGGQPEASEVKPWVWRQNVELVKEIPLKRLANWAVLLDRGYSLLSQGAVSNTWTLTQTLLEMTRSV